MNHPEPYGWHVDFIYFYTIGQPKQKEHSMKTILLLFAVVSALGSTSFAAPKDWSFTYHPKAKDTFTLTM